MKFTIICYGLDEYPDKPDYPDDPDNPAPNEKKWDSDGIQLKFSVFFVYSLIEVCLTYPGMHYAGWIEPNNPGFCQRPIFYTMLHSIVYLELPAYIRGYLPP